MREEAASDVFNRLVWSRSREDVLVDQPRNQRSFVPLGDGWIRHQNRCILLWCDHCEMRRVKRCTDQGWI